MSALPYTDWAVLCDYRSADGEPCMAQERTDTLDLRDGSTARDVRRILRRRGWTVNLANPDGSSRRLDYCPAHSPGGSNQ